jgi:endonuclease/exonuclease/phosphatase family metal-dependent hydrolase
MLPSLRPRQTFGSNVSRRLRRSRLRHPRRARNRAAIAAVAGSMTTLRVASFNVQRLSARQGARVEAIASIARALDADVLALQEIASGPALDVTRGAGLAHTTFVAHAASAQRGVAIGHRLPALASGGARIPARLGDDKGFTRVVIEAPSEPPSARSHRIEVVALHLDWLSRAARARQIASIASTLGAPACSRIVLGDTNAMSPGAFSRTHDDTVSELAERLGVRAPSEARPTFPSRRPFWALDWILATPDLSFVDVEMRATRSSDHAAILATLALA